MKRKKMMLSVIIVFTALLSQQVNAQDTTLRIKIKCQWTRCQWKKIKCRWIK